MSHRLSLQFVQRFLPFLEGLPLSRFLLQHMQLMNLQVQPQPQLDHIHAQTIINFDYCAICIFIGGFTDLVNVHTRNSAKQSRSEQVFALNLSFDTIIFCEKY
uniref:Uncharacterized protein n=1 Tax=uncultured marine crenarchaeote HF4000_APKG9P22 TaxID=455609 RepID=B3TBM1_9ARCH|nr:hypothetical protein ALOHA_HF4000APKG9P22ctg2g31 [uncultured marine crenarchaeote HF4000_APKG9P22]